MSISIIRLEGVEHDESGTENGDGGRGSTVIGWSRVKAYEAVKQGVLPAIRFGRRIVVPVAALDNWLATAGATGESGAPVA